MSFSELANENEFKVHKIIQEKQVTKSDLQSCLALSINLQERRITDNLKEARSYYNNQKI